MGMRREGEGRKRRKDGERGRYQTNHYLKILDERGS
jgi:hypothetical protein